MTEATTLGEPWGRYSYSTARDRVVISWGRLPLEAMHYFTAPRDRTISRKTTHNGDVLSVGGVPAVAESLEALVPAVREAVAQMPRHPSATVFPALDANHLAQVPVSQLLAATKSLLALVESEGASLSVLYGYVLPIMGPLFAEPTWGGEMSGIRLREDPHYYSLRAGLGVLDLVRHDPATGQELERQDVRASEIISSVNELGEIQICRETMDLKPFVAELRALLAILADVGEGVVTVKFEPSEDRSSMA